MIRTSSRWAVGLALISVASSAGAEEIALRNALAIPAVGRFGRNPLPMDMIEARIIAGTWTAPKVDDVVTLPDGNTRKWAAIEPNKDGVYSGRPLAGGYLYFTFESKEDQILMLEASGHMIVYVNGVPRTGDIYSNGSLRVPIAGKKGRNELLFQVARGQLRARLTPPKAAVFFDTADLTLPDVIAGQDLDSWAGIVVVNATAKTQSNLSVQGPGGIITPVRSLPPLSITKLPIRLKIAGSKTEKKVEAKFEIRMPDGKASDEVKVSLGVAAPGAMHRRTFISAIDGSVQYFAVVPAAPGATDPRPGLVLTLHGAGVEAAGQAACYSPKTWTHVAAATNRRPFGFDWEDWGRLDALEVLHEATRQLQPDPRRIYLTGHSMGGHGTWHLGVTFPDLFAAIGPSAGWVSMASYGGQRRPEATDPRLDLLWRATLPSDTLRFAHNLEPLGVYVLHGDKDDNVPVDQARTMKKALGEFHKDMAYHEQPGAGHWWGNACVDWPAMFEFFQKHQRPAADAMPPIDFGTASPSVSHRCHWVTIDLQQRSFLPSKIRIRYEAKERLFVGTTDNIGRLALDLSRLPPGPVSVRIDGQTLSDLAWPTSGTTLWLWREQNEWSRIGPPQPAWKNAQRCGPFRDGFRNRAVFVYGTKGDPAENEWALNKARLDAETFGYRGNGSFEVVADSAFDNKVDPDRNVVLYGNATTNAAWGSLLSDSPIQIQRGEWRVSRRSERGEEYSCLMIRPRPGSKTASVAVVSGTGLPGMRATNRLPYFTSGVGYPDYLIYSAQSWEGKDAIRRVGFFGEDWSVEKGEGK